MTNRTVLSSELAKEIGGLCVGADVVLKRPCTLDNPQPNALGFIKAPDSTTAERLRDYPTSVFLVPDSAKGLLTTPHIIVANPRSAFARALQTYFVSKPPPRIAATACVDASAVIGRDVVVGEYCVIGPGVSVGDNTEIRHHVVIGANVRIGRFCLIKSGAVIGEEGFGIDRDEYGNNIRLPHLGSVVVGDHVEIGAHSVVSAGTIDPTTINEHAKIDDHVFIAHNCRIGRNSIVVACAEVSGSVVVGEDVWLGPNSSVINGVSIGDRCFVGMGAAVIRSCEPNGVYAGVPAERKRERSTGKGTGA